MAPQMEQRKMASASPPGRPERRSTSAAARMEAGVGTQGAAWAGVAGRKALVANAWRSILAVLILGGSLLYISLGQLLVEMRHREVKVGVKGVANGSIGISNRVGIVRQANIFDFSRRALAVGGELDILGSPLINPWRQPRSKGWHACGTDEALAEKDSGGMNTHGYLLVSTNGGLNQMRAAICDMVAMAYWMNVTLVIPELDKGSFWADDSEFEDIFDVDHFVKTLKPLVPVVRTLPPKLAVRARKLPSVDPVSWSHADYYIQRVLPLIRKHGAVRLAKTDARLANNGLPISIQHVRCYTQFHALRFTPAIEALGRRLVGLMRERANGDPFLALHLRYEMDMLSFSGCTHGCSPKEEKQLTDLRYSVRHWREKEIDSERQRRQGLCPLTPEEAGLFLQALGFNESTHVYIAAGDIYGGQEKMSKLAAMFPNMVRKDNLLGAEELASISDHSSQQAALDYLVSLESDVFVPTFSGNMAKLIHGHRRYLGFRKTLVPDRKRLVEVLDHYTGGKATWGKAAERIRQIHRSQIGGPAKRVVIPKRPKLEDYFYSNPTECLCQDSQSFELQAETSQLFTMLQQS